MESLAMQQATNVYGDVNHLDVARYYIESELPNLFLGSHKEEMAEPIHQSIAELSDKNVWRLLEALSSTYRLNSVFSLVSNQAYDWREMELPIDSITLTGINPAVNACIYSEQINRSPLAFAGYLKRYFAEHPTDDPEGLGEFRPDGREVSDQHKTLLVFERNNELRMIDGSHRLMSYALAGRQTIRCFCATPNGSPSISNRGDSIFLQLRRAYTKFPDLKPAIVDLTEALARDSLDGSAAVESYWIDYVKQEEVRQAALEMLDRIKAREQME